MATALAPHVGAYLGGDDVVGPIATDYDLVDAVQAGLPVAAVDDLLARGLLAADEVDRLVLPRRTLSHRRARGERLTLDESDRLARVARVLAVAEASFGSAEKAGRWLRRPSRGLRGEVPLRLVVTTDGARLVEDELTRIASGDLA
jgi:putative toxin-antitoxin system antitoxin component (TIGR02293 family)